MAFGFPNSQISQNSPAPYGVLIREVGSATFDIAFIAKDDVSLVFTQFPFVTSAGAYIPGTNFLVGTNYDFIFFNPNLYVSDVRLIPTSNDDGLAFRDGEIGVIHEGTTGSLLNISTNNPFQGLSFNKFNNALNTTNITLQVVGIDPQSGFTNADGEVIAANEVFYKNLEYQTLAGVATGLVIPNKKNWLTSDGVVDVSSYIPYIAKTVNATQTDAPVISTSVIDTATTAISGTSVANATVTIFADAAQIQSVSANGSGAWSATIPTQALGKVITAKAISGINTLSNASDSVTVTAVNAVQTAAPVITTTSITTATTSISGTGVVAASIKIYGNGVEIVSGASTVGPLSSFTSTIPAQVLGVVITVKQQTSGELLSVVSNAVTVTAIAGVQTIAPNITNTLITTITTLISGTSEANASIVVLADTTQIGTATASVSGAWSAVIVAQTAGKVITAKAQVGTNTLSNASNALTVNNYLASSGGSSVTAETPDVEPEKTTDSMVLPLALLSVALFIGAAAGFIKGNKKVGILLFLGFLIALSSLIYKKTN